MLLRDLVKKSMLEYPSIMQSVAAVYVQMFATIGNGMEWNDEGRLVSRHEDDGVIPTHINVEHANKMLEEFPDDLGSVADLYRMKFIEEHIDKIVDSYTIHDLFSGQNHRLFTYMKPKYVSYNYAHIFNLPDNLPDDYITGIHRFLDYWQVSLNVEYGVGHHKDFDEATKHWPDDAKELCNRLNGVTKRLDDIYWSRRAPGEKEASIKRRNEIIDDLLQYIGEGKDKVTRA